MSSFHDQLSIERAISTKSMSLESPDLQLELKRALTLEIPSKIEPSLATSLPSSPLHTPPSSDDSGTPTPTTTVETTQSELTTLPTTSNATASSSSLPTLNVKFAPLPELLPRKRRSTVPLGMAARGQARRRRSGYKDRNAPPMWTAGGSEEYRRQQEELAARHARFAAYAAYAAAREEERDDDDDDDDIDWHRQRRRRGRKKGKNVDEVDDPLLVIGRMVKVAGRTLWKRVSHKDVAAAAVAATAISTPESQEGSKDTGDGHSNTGSPTPTKASKPPSPALPPIPGTTTSIVDDHHVEEYEEGEREEGVEGEAWEEDSFPRNISQTETIIEGRAIYPRLASKVDVLSDSPPPSPRKMTSFLRPPSTKKIPPIKPKLVDGGS
ncbi:hypothetical protein BYT27DRAFT_7254863 [Phlegmacium glaucopus]|nr:hypothetical protein BYT27DRAFT_7254863 [Phlegmacium glaucopus]